MVIQEEVDEDWTAYRAVDGMRLGRIALALFKPFSDTPAFGLSVEDPRMMSGSNAPANVDKIVSLTVNERVLRVMFDGQAQELWVQTKVALETATKDFIFNNGSGEILSGPPGTIGHASRIVRVRAQILAPISEDQTAFAQAVAPGLKSKIELIGRKIAAQYGRPIVSDVQINQAGIGVAFVADASADALAMALASLINI